MLLDPRPVAIVEARPVRVAAVDRPGELDRERGRGASHQVREDLGEVLPARRVHRAFVERLDQGLCSLERLHAALPSRVILVLDAAYAECVTADDYKAGESLAAKYDNVIMTRTFSKMYALAGLRVGWAYGAPGIIDMINRVRMPFNVCVPGHPAAIEAVRDQDIRLEADFSDEGEVVTKLGVRARDRLAKLNGLQTRRGYLESVETAVDGRVKEFIDWWHQEYRKRFSNPYHFNGGKEGRLIKDLLRDYDLPRLRDIAGLFLDSTDPWVQQTGGFTIGVFCSQINKIISTAKANPNRSQPKEMPL